MKFMRASQIIARIGVSKSTFWQYVKEGKLPQPIKPSSKISLWRECDIDFAMQYAFQNGGCPTPAVWAKRLEDETKANEEKSD